VAIAAGHTLWLYRPWPDLVWRESVDIPSRAAARYLWIQNVKRGQSV